MDRYSTVTLDNYTSPKMLDAIVGETIAVVLTNLINKLRFKADRPEAFCLS